MLISSASYNKFKSQVGSAKVLNFVFGDNQIMWPDGKTCCSSIFMFLCSFCRQCFALLSPFLLAIKLAMSFCEIRLLITRLVSSTLSDVSQLVLYSNVSCWSSTKLIASSNQQKVTCSRFDVIENCSYCRK